MGVEKSRSQGGVGSRNSRQTSEIPLCELSSANFIDHSILDDNETFVNEFIAGEDLDLFNDKKGLSRHYRR
jgi:hypothetical protein